MIMNMYPVKVFEYIQKYVNMVVFIVEDGGGCHLSGRRPPYV